MELESGPFDLLVNHIDDVDCTQELLLDECSKVLAEEFLSDGVLLF